MTRRGSFAFSLREKICFIAVQPAMINSPSDDLLEVILKYDLTDILLNRNAFGGSQITGTGTHSGADSAGVAPRKRSRRKYACPCCGMSVRATKVVNIASLICLQRLTKFTAKPFAFSNIMLSAIFISSFTFRIAQNAPLSLAKLPPDSDSEITS